MFYGQHINQQLLLDKFVFPLIIKFWLVKWCYLLSLFFFWEFLQQAQTNRKKNQNKTILAFFSWVPLFFLFYFIFCVCVCLIHPPPSLLISDSSPLLLFCCWKWLTTSASAAQGVFSRSHIWVGAQDSFLDLYHCEAGLCTRFSTYYDFLTKESLEHTYIAAIANRSVIAWLVGRYLGKSLHLLQGMHRGYLEVQV